MTVLTRRNVLAGACGTCAVVVAGCAAYGPASAPAAAPSAAPAPAGGSGNAGGNGGGGDAAPAGGIPTSKVPVGGGIILADQGVVVTQPKKGTFKAFSAVCTHQGCTVSAVENGTITCPCHGSAFAVADGSVVNGPASEPLPAKNVKVSGATLTVS